MTYIGKSIKRVEDKRFITGKGNYTDDIVMTGMTFAAFVRSPYGHAKVKNVDVSKAKKMPGVVAIFTGADVAAVNGVPCGWQVNFKNGDTMKEPKHPLLVADKTRHVGDPVAIIIAETREQAKDAVEAVVVDYEKLPCVTNAAEAVKPGAPKVHDELPNNICFDWELGNPKSEVDAAMSKASHVTTLEFINQRLIPNAMEPRSYIGSYDETNDKYTLYTSTQNPHLVIVNK